MKLSQQFRGSEFGKATGLRNPTSCLVDWSQRGWVRRVSQGVYERTPSFPGAPAKVPKATVRVSVPGLDKEELSIEQQIQKACKERDDALARGHDKLAQILQDKINGLQEKVGL